MYFQKLHNKTTYYMGILRVIKNTSNNSRLHDHKYRAISFKSYLSPAPFTCPGSRALLQINKKGAGRRSDFNQIQYRIHTIQL